MAPIKKGKKKKDEKKSGPKGKKERAKAKLDNRWGEYDLAASKNNNEKETSPFTSSTGTTDDLKESKKKSRIVAVRKKKKVENKTRHRRNEGVEGFYQRLQQGKRAHQQQTREQEQRKVPFTSAVSNSDSSSSDDDEDNDENQSETSSMNGDNDNNTAMGDLLSMIRKKNNAKQLLDVNSSSSDEDDEGSSSEDDESSDEDDDDEEDEVMVDANGDHNSNAIVIAVDGNDNNNNNTIKKVKTTVDFFRQRFSRPSLTKSELQLLSQNKSQQKKKANTTKMEKISVPFSSTKQRGGGGGDVELHYTPSPLSVTSSSTIITAAINDTDDNNNNNNSNSNICDDLLALAGRENNNTNTPEAWQSIAMDVYNSDNTRDVLRNNWNGMNEKKKKKKTSSTMKVLSEIQAPVYSCLSRYTDSFVTTTSNSGSSSSKSNGNSKEQQDMHQLYLFHVLNHVLTSRSRIGRNNRYLKAQEILKKKQKEEEAKEDDKKEAAARKQRKEQLDEDEDDDKDNDGDEEEENGNEQQGNKMEEDNDNEEEENKMEEVKNDDDDDDSEVVQQQQEVVEEMQKLKEEQRDVRDQGFTRPTVLVLLPTRGTCYTFIKELYQLTGAANMTPEQEQRFEDDYGKDLEDDIDDEEDGGAGGKGGGSSSMKKKAADKERRRKAILQNKGKEWNEYFGDTANQDDDFKIGISLIPKAAATATSTEQPKVSNVSVKLYSDFYKSDIIVASPLGLKMMITPDTGDDADDDNHTDVDVNEHGGGRHDKSSFDYLSSIEICLLQHSEMILMQNWDHVNDILQLLNQEPKHNNSTDFSRVRNYLLEDDVNNGTGTNGEGKSTNSVLDLGGSYGQQLSQQRQGQYWRQLIISSKFMDPTLLSSFKRFSKSLSGAVKVRRKIREGVLSNVFVPMKQVFQQIPVKSFHYQSKARVEYFMQHLLPTIQRNEQTHTCLYIPSYFDFCALRNTLLKNELVNLFVSVTEYARATEISRGRARFLQGRKPLLLYTGRAHFFHRHAIKGIRNLIFFGLPEQAEFYSDYVNLIATASSGSSIGDQHMMVDTNNEGSSMNNNNKETSCIALFTKYEVHALERIVGSTNCNKMISSTNSTFMFYS